MTITLAHRAEASQDEAGNKNRTGKEEQELRVYCNKEAVVRPKKKKKKGK